MCVDYFLSISIFRFNLILFLSGRASDLKLSQYKVICNMDLQRSNTVNGICFILYWFIFAAIKESPY